MPLWWNWQTRWTQNPVVVIPCRFDSDQRHQKMNQENSWFVFLFISKKRINQATHKTEKKAFNAASIECALETV